MALPGIPRLAPKLRHFLRIVVIPPRLRFEMNQKRVLDIDVPIARVHRVHTQKSIVESDRGGRIKSADFVENLSAHRKTGTRHRRHFTRGIHACVCVIFRPADQIVSRNALNAHDHAAVLDCAVRIKQFSTNGSHVLLHDIGRNPPQP